MNRDEFYKAMSSLDDAAVRKALWTVYWRSAAPVRERIEEALRPADATPALRVKELPDPDLVLNDVTEFVELAESGAYMAGDRRVSRNERSKWRVTFRRLADEAMSAMAAPDSFPAEQALELIIDLACQLKSYDYFHSDDPVEAAKFVVSDAVAGLWQRILHDYGRAAFARRAAPQLVRWEQEYGWTRRGYGTTAENETSLAVVLEPLLATPDMWREFAESYLDALTVAATEDLPDAKRGYRDGSWARRDRADRLAGWHDMLADRMAGTPDGELLGRIAASPALGGPRAEFLRAKIAYQEGDAGRARELVARCLKELPGSRAFIGFAVELGVEVPKRSREIAGLA
jgi:hypothetical protein